jgi:hypothetical protein
LGGILLSVIVGVRIDVLLSYYGNDMMSAAQVAGAGLASGDDAVKQSGVDGFWVRHPDLRGAWRSIPRRPGDAGPCSS